MFVNLPSLLVCVDRMDMMVEHVIIREIFRHVPQVNESLIAVEFHSWNGTIKTSEEFARLQATWRIERYLKDFLICFSFTYIGNETLKTAESRNNMYLPHLFRVVMKLQLFASNSEMYIVLVPRHTKNFAQADSLYEVKRRQVNGTYVKSIIVAMSYSLYRHERLRSPYVTNCKNYTDEGLLSQSHCRDDCMRRNFMKSYGGVPFWVLVEDGQFGDHDLLQREISTTEKRDKLIKLYYEVDQVCDKRCAQPDCVSEEFVPHVKKIDDSDEQVAVSVCDPIIPDIVTQYVPAVQLVEFITNILSACAFWTGAAPLGILQKWNPFRRT